MMQRLRFRLPILATALVLSSCLPGPTVEPVPFSDPSLQVQSIALMRTTWQGTRPDAFCQPEIGRDIDWQLKSSLTRRGYQVLPLVVADLDNSNRPDPAATLNFNQLKSQVPEGANAVMRLRIVEYLDASLCDSAYEAKSLSMTGIAELFDVSSGEKIWETRQLCHDISRSTRDVVFACTNQLGRRIVQRLPAPGN